MAYMKIQFRLAPCEYSRNMVTVAIPWTAIASSDVLELRNVQEFRAARQEFIAPFINKVDAKLFVNHGDQRKFAGFDAVQREPVELHCEAIEG